MRVIDAHVHLYQPEVGRDPMAWAAANREPHWAALCGRRRKNGRPVQGFPAVAQMLRDMDAGGISQAVLLGWYWENHQTCIRQNEHYAACIAAHPDRFAAFGSVHVAAGRDALDEVRRMKDARFIGVGELSPHSQHVAPDNPWWGRLLHLAGELKLPVNLHVTDPDTARYPGRVETPLVDFARMAAEYPETKFILAHWGGGMAFDAKYRALKNVYFDSAASPLMYGPDAWRRAAAAMRDDRILFGSDYPLNLYPATEAEPGFSGIVEEAMSAGLTESNQKALFSGNALKLFGPAGFAAATRPSLPS